MTCIKKIQGIGQQAHDFLVRKVSENPEGINLNPEGLEDWEIDLPIINGYMKHSGVYLMKIMNIKKDEEGVFAFGESVDMGSEMIVPLKDLDVEGLCILADWLSE